MEISKLNMKKQWECTVSHASLPYDLVKEHVYQVYSDFLVNFLKSRQMYKGSTI